MNQARNNIVRRIFISVPDTLFALRVAGAAITAFSIAAALGLESPYWAAMTSLVVIQPTRGQLLEKSAFRLLGSTIGSIVGITILVTSTTPGSLSLMLCIWLAACVAIGNLLGGFRSYGVMVAGFTAAVISLTGYNQPMHLGELIVARIGCIGIGIVISTVATLFFAPRDGIKTIKTRLRNVVVASIRLLAYILQGAGARNIERARNDIMNELADIEYGIDAAWAGTLDLKRRKLQVENLIVDLLSSLETGVLLEHRLQIGPEMDKTACLETTRQLKQLAQELDRHRPDRPAKIDPEAIVAQAQACFPLLATSLNDLFGSLLPVIEASAAASRPSREVVTTKAMIRTHDWAAAAKAVLRTTLGVGSVGLIWHWSGWQYGPAMMIATSIMISIFSTRDKPAVLLMQVLTGASIGAVLAMACRTLILPADSTPFMHLSVLAPLLLCGSIAKTHRKIALSAHDAMMFFMIVMQPGMPTQPGNYSYVVSGAASVGGIALAMLSFLYLVPMNPAVRLHSILVAIVRDLDTMATVNSPRSLERCRNRTRFRVLHLLLNARHLDHDTTVIMNGALAALAISRVQVQAAANVAAHRMRPELEEEFRQLNRELSAGIDSSGISPEQVLPVLTDAAHRFCMLAVNQQSNP